MVYLKFEFLDSNIYSKVRFDKIYLRLKEKVYVIYVNEMLDEGREKL